MSGLGFIAPEPDRECELCHKVAETRPYGPKGEQVCFDCGMKDKDACMRGFKLNVLGIND